jgi:CHAT domain-containing protein
MTGEKECLGSVLRVIDETAATPKYRTPPSFLNSAPLFVVILSLLVFFIPGDYSKVNASPEYSQAEGEAYAAAAVQGDVPALEAGKTIRRAIQGGETHLFRITVASGQYLRAVIEQQGIDVAVALLGPDGARQVEIDGPSGKKGYEPISVVAEASGEYRIEVRAPKVPPGHYEIRVEALRTPTEADLARVAAEREFRQACKLLSQPSAQSKRDAIEKLEQILPAFRAMEDRAMEFLILNQVGLLYHFLRDLQKALSYYDRALTLCRSMGDREYEASVLNNTGGVYDILAEPHKALDYYNQALSMFQTLGDSAEQGNTLNNIAVIYANLGDRQKALEDYGKALPLIQKAGNVRREAITLDNIGGIYTVLGEPQRALDYHTRALELRRAVKDPRSEARSLQLIGYAHAAMGNTAMALEYYNQSLAMHRTVGDKSSEATTLNRIALVYTLLGEPQRSLEYNQQALQLVRALGDRKQEAYTLAGIGQAYTFSGQPDKSLEYCRQAITLAQAVEDRSGQAIALQLLAHAERDTGNLVEARKHIEAAVSRISAMRADISSQLFRTSYLAKEQGGYEFYIDLLMRMHRLNPSEGHDRAALAVSEQARARTLLEVLTESRVDIRQGVDPALIGRERNLSQLLDAKARRLMQLLGQQNTREQAEALKKEISQIENEYQQVRGEIRKNSPLYAAITQPQPLSPLEIQQQLLDKDSTLLEYSLGEDRSYLWAVTTDSMKSYVLPKREEIEKAAREVYNLLTARSAFVKGESPQQKQQRTAAADALLSDATARLSRMVLGPVSSGLGHNRLVVVADGALQYVPFAMLSAAVGDSDTGTYQPLVVDHEIISLPSASSLAIMRDKRAGRKPAPNGIAVIADPVFSSADQRLKARPNMAAGKSLEPEDAATFTRIIEHSAAAPSGERVIPRLPFTRQEAEQILSVAGVTGNLKLLDFKASKSSVTSAALGSFRYVHFATHGYLDTERPRLSAIVLSTVDPQGKPQDGFLRVHEIYNLRLPAELVVLSACQTGLGKEIKGEGLDGITRGFMYAGAARVVVSLWSVDDRATSELMAKFYKAMIKDKQRPAAALQAAQVEMWKQKQWRSPYFWAAFTLQGEWR